MSEQTARRSLNTEVKVVSEKDGVIEYIASDETLDSHREIVRVDGWRFNRFAKNAPFVDSHDYWTIGKLLGRVVSAEVVGAKLVERVKWAIDVPGCDLAKLGFDLTVKGYLKAVSVGFMVVKWASPGTDDFAKACAEMKLSTDTVARLRCIYLEQEQIELSACIIGSNPEALARAYHAGDIKDEQLAKCGFSGDAEMELLIKSGEVWDKSDPVTQYRIRRELEAVSARSLSGKSKSTASTPSKPDGGDEAERLADEELKEISRRLAEIAQQRAAAMK